MNRFIVGIIDNIGFLHLEDSNSIAENYFSEEQCLLLGQAFAEAAKMLKEVREGKATPTEKIGVRHDLKTWMSGKN